MIRKTKYAGMDISLEFKKGELRSGVNREGVSWERKMTADYGYILKTNSPDGEHLDCYIVGKKETPIVYVVHQLTFDGEKYDEDKCVLGARTAAQAKEVWASNMPKPSVMFGGVSEFDIEHFRVIAHSAKKSTIILGREDQIEKLRKRGLLQKKIKSPIELSLKINETFGPWRVVYVVNKKPAINRLFETYSSAKNWTRNTGADPAFDIILEGDEKANRMLKEGFGKNDLEGLLLPEISLDVYKAKAEDNVVLAFFIQNEPAAVPPLIAFCRGTPGVSDVDASDSDTIKNTSIVYVEFARRMKYVRHIRSLITDVAAIANLKNADLMLELPAGSEKYPYSPSIVKAYMKRICPEEQEHDPITLA